MWWRLILVCAIAGCGRLGFEDREITDADPDDGSPGTDANAPPSVSYIATLAECLDPVVPSLSSCTTTNGANQLVVDGKDGSTNHPWQGYLRFDLDTALEGRTVTSVKLVMTATDDPKAMGPDSGDIWQVTAFDRASLATASPSTVGASPLAASIGAVSLLQVVEWPLPTSAVAANTALYLGAITTDASGGVNYWNLVGANPPKLVVVLQ